MEQTDPFTGKLSAEAIAALGLRGDVGLVTPIELANALGATEQTLAAWRSTNQGPDFVKLGRSVFYRLDDIRAWVNRCVTAMTA